MTDLFLPEILEQPSTMLAAARGVHDQVPALELLRASAEKARHVVLTGMGSSHDVCLAVASVLGSAGVLATTVNTAELVHFRLPTLGPDTLLIAVSQSGRSAELVRLARDRAANGTRSALVSVTNGLDNELAAEADVALDTCGGDEFGPSSKTYAASCVMLAALARVLAGESPRDVSEVVATLTADAAREASVLLEEPRVVARAMTDWLGKRTSLLIVGRGTARAAAEVGALVMKEAATFAAESLDAAEFRHGPLELAGPRLAVAIIATEPSTGVLDRQLAEEVAAHGSAVLLVTADRSDGVNSERTGVALTTTESGIHTLAIRSLDRLLAPAVGVIPFQLLAWQLALDAGRSPGLFVAGAKVTTKE